MHQHSSESRAAANSESGSSEQQAAKASAGTAVTMERTAQSGATNGNHITSHSTFPMSAASAYCTSPAVIAARSLLLHCLLCPYACLVDDIDDHCELAGQGTIVDHHNTTDLNVHKSLHLHNTHKESSRAAAEQRQRRPAAHSEGGQGRRGGAAGAGRGDGDGPFLLVVIGVQRHARATTSESEGGSGEAQRKHKSGEGEMTAG